MHPSPVRVMASRLLLLRFPWPARPLRRCRELLQQLQRSWNGVASPQWAPALAVQGPSVFTELAHETNGNKENSSFLDSIFWMAAPKNRRTIEVNLCRRRDPRKLIKAKNNIDICPECGHLKQKHVLCGYCYEKVRKETTKIRQQIWAQEGNPFKAPTVETVVLYTGEKPSEQDQGKRIVERNMKRPSWFTQN
ncbi:39S ribosomal protein L32, mitochondrial [Mesocricetus auratus]|uniref:Large ribosomal subunit protein bL32m n=1 Tax=Mesocricetus auratus TaxID=10036 RepID=A0A1U7QS29_MESAU|nr:39S ribosomal protein L32, mitochondrial [Mesocricetus auratus]